MESSLAEIHPDLPRIVIVGVGISGLVVASMLADVPADVTVLEQVMPPGRDPGFAGIVSDADLRAIGLTPPLHDALPVARIVDGAADSTIHAPHREPAGWSAIPHRGLLDRLKSSIASRGVTLVPDATVTGFLWDGGVVSGVRNAESGASFPANLVVLADESSPRLPEHLGLRSDWAPTELMHLGKRRYTANPATVRERLGVDGRGHEIISLETVAPWGASGWGLVIPGPDSITVIGAMSLEDAMVSTRHISEYLDEIEGQAPVRERIAGLHLESYRTEVVPTGGFDARNSFDADGVLVVNDLVGVTHPLNRDGLSSNLAVCHAAARTIATAVTSGDYRGVSLRAYSSSIMEEVVSPVDAARRTDKALRPRPPWLWASKADLFSPTGGVTAGQKSATLPGMGISAAWHRLRGSGRIPGVRRHAPGQYDE